MVVNGVLTNVNLPAVHHYLSRHRHARGYFCLRNTLYHFMKLITTLSLVLLSIFSQGQEPSIHGTIRDEKNAPMEFVNVILQNVSDSVMVKTAASDVNGYYELIGVPSGNYTLLYKQVGYADFTSTPFQYSEGSNLSMPDVNIISALKELDAVEYVYVKPLVEIKADKTVFNVEGTTNATGLNAMELLRKAPGVMIDNNENIMVKGKGGIVVYIDGKLSPLDGDGLKDMLKNMQSSNIESIEIITNPSAKFDAAGNAGIINIKLKKNKNFGTNGNIALGYGVQRYSKYNTSFAINHRNAKFNYYANYGNNWGEYWSFMKSEREQNGSRYNQNTDNSSDGLKHNFKGGVDYFINDKHTVGLMVNGNVGENFWYSNSRTEITDITPGNDRTLIANAANSGRRDNLAGNINYRFTDTLGHFLNVDLDYGNYDMYNDSYQPNTYYNPTENVILYENNFRNNTSTLIDLMTAKADYEQDFFKGKLGAGFKVSYVETDNQLDFFNVINNQDFIDTTRSNTFEYLENINAGYINYNRQIKKIGIQVGLRAEHTVSKGELVSQTTTAYEKIDRNYINFFPSAALTYNRNEKHTYNLTYSRRIDRPSYQDLNPFEYRLDELSYQKGNVNLRPQLTDAFELSHTYKYAFNTSLSYSRTNDFFTEITDTTEVARSFISPRNLGYQEYFGLNIGSPFKISKWWGGYANVSVYQIHNRADFGEGKIIDIRANSYSLYMNNSFTVTKTWGFELSGWYSGPGIWGGTFQNDPMWSMDVGMKKTFWNDKAALRLSLGDIFWASQWRGVSQFGGLYMVASGGWESRQFRVNFSYSFGNQNVKGRDRKTGSDDITNRVK